MGNSNIESQNSVTSEPIDNIWYRWLRRIRYCVYAKAHKKRVLLTQLAITITCMDVSIVCDMIVIGDHYNIKDIKLYSYTMYSKNCVMQLLLYIA